MKITVNWENSFLICDEYGDIAEGFEQGLFHQDTRFLSHYKLLINGEKPILLSSSNVGFYSSFHYLTNPQIDDIPASSLVIVRKRFLGEGLHEDIEITNFAQEDLSLDLRLIFYSDFADIFEVRGAVARHLRLHDVEHIWENGDLSFTYSGPDIDRVLTVAFSRKPQPLGQSANFKIKLTENEKWHLCANFGFQVGEQAVKTKFTCGSYGIEIDQRHRELDQWVEKAPSVTSDYHFLDHAYSASLKDLAALRLAGTPGHPEEAVTAAGIPWYMTVFGRDALIAAYQTILTHPEIARSTIIFLAQRQGVSVNDLTSEEPGKIMHELRFGEAANLSASPDIYYGSIDATILYLILIHQYFKFSGDRDFLQEFLPSAESAIRWIDDYGDMDGDGFVEYQIKPNGRLTNQGWKDSANSVRFQNGELATGPIALCEVQGYVYDAKMKFSELYETLGENEKAHHLKGEALELKSRFNRDFWLDDSEYFALALDGGKNRVDSITSNPGHLLWSGIVEDEKAGAIVRKLFSPQVYSGWGIRTMSTGIIGYNPMSYHNGSVWPHDNSLIMAGLTRYGYHEKAKRLFLNLLEASDIFPGHRFPELFCGFGREDYSFPISYPTANCPQSWAAGATILMLKSMLGIDIDCAEKSITIDPHLPMEITILRFEKLKVGDLRFGFDVKTLDGETEVEILEMPPDFVLYTEKKPILSPAIG